MLERRHSRLATALALIAVLGFSLPASALPFGSAARQPNLAGWTLDSLVDWFQSLLAARWVDGGEPAASAQSVEKLSSIGGTGGGTGGSTGNGGNGSAALPDGASLPGNP